MESQLSNALGLVEKYQKLAFLWHFENFLSLLVKAKKGLFWAKTTTFNLGVNRHEKSFSRNIFKTTGTLEFSIFFAQNFKSDAFDTMFEISTRNTRFK